eukprot:TRINITY_DN4488_c0_g2_i2.p1 TRINITY_DN4488_c0_g2~~TRINITY_DN4488_c0_g2_i2.p1  ORF type:complete len:275 (+),score=43.71 TRINITY_DN4488_c0_g2_i2:152-976(+)
MQPKRSEIAQHSGSIVKDGVIKYPDGSSRTKGTFVLPEGTITEGHLPKINPGDQRLKDETILQFDETVRYPSGAILRRDGNLRMKDGRIIPPLWPCRTAPRPPGVTQSDEKFTFMVDDKNVVVEPPNSNVAVAYGVLKIQTNLTLSVDGCFQLKVEEARGLNTKEKECYVRLELVDYPAQNGNLSLLPAPGQIKFATSSKGGTLTPSPRRGSMTSPGRGSSTAVFDGLPERTKGAKPVNMIWKWGGEVKEFKFPEIGRAVQQECRDRSRMPSSA